MAISGFDISHIDEIIAGEGDWFTARLLRLMAHADKDNLGRLGSAYPEEFAHFCKWRYGAIPSEYSLYNNIYEFVNSRPDFEWLSKEGKTFKLVLITNKRDF